MWFNIFGTNQKHLLSWLPVEQIIYPSLSSLLPLMGVLLCVRCTDSFTCIISTLEVSELGIIAVLTLQVGNLKLSKIK